MMMFDDTLISIHAPTRGATIPPVVKKFLLIFQSTLPREERLARALGALGVYIFQSTLPREERRDNMKVIAEIEKFQSTLPREERLSSQARLIWWNQHFNPRSHERSDNSGNLIRGGMVISIHAPTRGATFRGFFYRVIHMISIHAPTRGATCSSPFLER